MGGTENSGCAKNEKKGGDAGKSDGTGNLIINEPISFWKDIGSFVLNAIVCVY